MAAGWRAVVVVVLGLLASGCPSNRGNEGPYEPYLVVWAGGIATISIPLATFFFRRLAH